MMEDNFEDLVDELSKTPLSIDILQQITLLIEEQTDQSLSSFISQSFESLFILENWAWKQLSQNSEQWITLPNYLTLFHTLASFNKNLIFIYNTIDDDAKALLLIPETVEEINKIFTQINQSDDDYDLYIAIVSLWFDNLSLFIYEKPQFDALPVICYINQYIARQYLMTEQFKLYLSQFQNIKSPQTILSVKQLFYIKTCSFSLRAYLIARAQRFPYTAEQMLNHIGNEYLQIIQTYSCIMNRWSQHILASIMHLTGFISACCWWGGESLLEIKILFPNDKILCEFVQGLIRIITYEPFSKQIKSDRSNNETILIDIFMKFFLHILQALNITWFVQSILSLPDALLLIAENSPFEEISLCTYAVLGEILTDEKLKELQVTDSIEQFFFSMLEQAWKSPTKKYKQIPILYLLRGFLSLSKSDAIQQKIANSQKILILIELCDEYSMTFDIIWALSFNRDIQQQLRASSVFTSKLSYLAKECHDEQMRKTIHGILWNLEINHDNHSLSEINDENTFDIMISYSHKDKILCKQIYDELIKADYRVWIDFDQMHGNVMDAMAQAIEQSHIIIICMSEEYRKSNYCRAEAHYAFQRRRQIIPVLVQKYYRPDGWLLFLFGQLLYVDFIKYEFPRAMELLFNELNAEQSSEASIVTVEPKRNSVISTVTLSIGQPRIILPPLLPNNVTDWTQGQVQDWLGRRNLVQISRLLADCNGRDMLCLDDFIRNGDKKQVLTLLQAESLEKTGQSLSLTELACFRTLMEDQRRLMQPNIDTQLTKNNNNTSGRKRTFVCCRMM